MKGYRICLLRKSISNPLHFTKGRARLPSTIELIERYHSVEVGRGASLPSTIHGIEGKARQARSQG
jgi:hypothetical protein